MSLLDDIQEATEAGLETDRIRELRSTVDRLQRSLVKEKDRTDAIVEAIEVAVRDSIAALVIPPIGAPPKRSGKKNSEVAVAVLSDWQLGKKTPTYSSEVCEERMGLYGEKLLKLVEIQRQSHPVDELAVFLLGDMIEGELVFPGQAWQIDSSLFRQITVDGPRILSHFVRTMAVHFPKVTIHAVPGNHGYLGGRSRREMHPESNGDRMLYQICSQLTENLGNVTWNVALDWWLAADLGEKCRFMLCHGNQVKGFAGLPWYGWSRKVMGWHMMGRIWPEMRFDYVAAGHFHTPVTMYINGVRLWVNASTESHNPYAQEQLAAAGEPAQWLLFAKPGMGVSAEYLVQL